jgi:uncharacterized protein YjcR
MIEFQFTKWNLVFDFSESLENANAELLEQVQNFQEFQKNSLIEAQQFKEMNEKSRKEIENVRDCKLYIGKKTLFAEALIIDMFYNLCSYERITSFLPHSFWKVKRS